jgi:oligopeptide transport system substrate-binding protein
MKSLRLSLALVLPIVYITACGGSSSSSGGGVNGNQQLAANQVLRFPIIADISTLDPALVQSVQDNAEVQEVFGGLYRFDDKLKELPSIAADFPQISTDGLTYTFSLRHDVKFSNGDAVTSADVVYSWNRAARQNGQNGFIFKPIAGYSDVVAPSGGTPKSTTMSGLTAVDPYTVKATLSEPASYWIDELAIAPAYIVNQKMISGDLDRTWSTDPAKAIGTGPFKLTAYAPKDHLSFANVPNWWGGSTGTLTDVEVTVIGSSSSQVTKYQSGGLDEIGPANTRPPLDAVLRFQADPNLKSQIFTSPGGSTTWVGFNMAAGPFAPDPSAGVTDPVALAGRLAFSQSIDRSKLVNVACGQGGQTCAAASGGVIPKGLRGNLGDGKDTSAEFNADKAKQELATWDPNGTKRQGLTYWYYSQDLTKTVAENLQSQWQQNLGVHVDIQGVDFTSYLATLEKKQKYMLFADFTQAFYDNPQEWFDSQFICSQAGVGLGNLDGFCDPRVDALVAKAKSQNDADSIATFQQANQLLADNGAFAIVYYASNQYFIQPYVRGAGGNPLNDYSWTNINIMSH